MVSAPQGSWALKGGVALLARLRDGARATTDADATWRVDFDSLEHTLDMVAMLNLHDGFSFRIGRPKPLTTETDEGGMRFPVVSMLAGREFERFHLDVNLVPEDPRPVETVALRNVLGFAGLDPPVVPVVPIAQHLAEKFHAHTRHYGGFSSRPRDLYDMLVIAERLPIPDAATLVEACQVTFEIRRTVWPPDLPTPPAEWADAWKQFELVYGIPWPDLPTAGEALALFWRPLLAGSVAGEWDARSWEWRIVGA
jgi:hypothetical protein